ncbi:MAG: putative toxin-antitoxin system toxin component, PIN family [Bacteroidales bacterium]|nr:putative toxin-antitoxin system toxin component, PIN family [Bacteroidales bacterium]
MKRKSKKYKIIIDTNIWISFLIGKSLRGLQNHIDSQSIKIITCKEQYCELSEVFKKPKIKKYFTKEQVEEFFELLDESSDCIELATKSNVCRDAKDNYLVSLAIDSHSNFLITGDQDLLELNRIEETLVVRYSDFEQLLKQ